jgi:3',5'-cyclic AMP phosphodiesterase CpdA
MAQISDLHVQHGKIVDTVRAAQHLERGIATLNRLDPRPDLVVMTGDLTEHGRTEEYQVLQSIISRLEIPYWMIPGNHDSPARLREVFAQERYLQSGSAFIHYAIDTFPIRILALDTTVPGQSHGALCAARLAWLADRLAEQPGRPTVVLMHHPPFDTGIRQMDAIGLLGGRQEFIELITPYSNIERVLCGHVHRTIVCRVGNAVASTCPGTSHQVELDLRDPGGLGANFEPPGYQLHWFHPGGGAVTHHALIGQFDGPYYE